MKFFIRLFITVCSAFLCGHVVLAQAPEVFSSAKIIHEIQKLNQFGKVLYIAAHPDDENTRLLAYLANERKYATAYLSLTRGDGGQNLIGDEQGIALGLIRTQELLAARRIDGAEQFFTSAYDFGYSKSPDETLKKWGKEKILSDVVYVIRKFCPDIIITRFPTTGEGGHGHHTASAILAEEAFDAAADSTKFTNHFKLGLKPWKTKRLYWNTFNFGGNNTQREDQIKINVGDYNALVGKSYGEIAAESRSQHKSQGFGVPSQRGDIIEYFKLLKGMPAGNDIMGSELSSMSVDGFSKSSIAAFQDSINSIVNSFQVAKPYLSVDAFVRLFKSDATKDVAMYKKEAISRIVFALLGLYTEVSAQSQLLPITDSVQLSITANNRLGYTIDALKIALGNFEYTLNRLEKNKNISAKINIPPGYFKSGYQPFWLENPLEGGARFNIDETHLAEAYNQPIVATANITLNGVGFQKQILVTYKSTDPVKGEQVQPVAMVNPVFVNTSPAILLFSNDDKNVAKEIVVRVRQNASSPANLSFSLYKNNHLLKKIEPDSINSNPLNEVTIAIKSNDFARDSKSSITASADTKDFSEAQFTSLQKISYDHIPDVFYQYIDDVKVLKLDLKIVGKNAGYISGAGDKVADALGQMGYNVKLLHEDDLTPEVLNKLDVVVTGVRAYNVHSWLISKYDVLMEYVKNGGKLVVQYNTNNNLGPMKDKIGPYPFTIGRKRITDELARVQFVDSSNQLLHFPNKISMTDFSGWVQERSIYHAEAVSPNYKQVFSMADEGEKADDGSLIVANYGRGTFVYTGLVFFRQLPAGVPGAYRLFANIVANKKSNH